MQEQIPKMSASFAKRVAPLREGREVHVSKELEKLEAPYANYLPDPEKYFPVGVMAFQLAEQATRTDVSDRWLEDTYFPPAAQPVPDEEDSDLESVDPREVERARAERSISVESEGSVGTSSGAHHKSSGGHDSE